MQRGTYVLRVFTSDAEDIPIGVVGLSNLNPHFKTANIWVVLGDRAHAGQGYASRATSRMLTLRFTELGLRSVHTWIVEHNLSIHVARRVKFRLIGTQRQCHYIDGRASIDCGSTCWPRSTGMEDARNHPATSDRQPVLNSTQP